MSTISLPTHSSWQRSISNGLLICLGILSACFGIKGFLLSAHFIDGGVMGISMLMAHVLHWPLAILVMVLNLPFVLLGFKQLGKAFAIKSTLAIAALACTLAVLQFPIITEDKLLIAVFGGFFIGGGIGLAIRAGAVLDGTEIAALLISRAVAVLKVSDVILLMNIIIFLTAAFFLGVEPALYSVLTYLSAYKTVDFLIHGLEEYTALVIISTQSEVIREVLLSYHNRTATIYKGRRGSSGLDQDILYCVVTRLEVGPLKQTIAQLDEAAFVITHTVNDVEGGVVKRQAFH